MNIELDKEIMDAVDRFEKALVDPSADNFKEFEDSRTGIDVGRNHRSCYWH